MIFKKLKFRMQIAFVRRVLKRWDSLFSYPLLVTLDFQRDWYWKWFLAGCSVIQSTIQREKIMRLSMDRRIHRGEIHPRVLDRLERIKDARELKRELDEVYKSFPELKEEWEGVAFPAQAT